VLTQDLPEPIDGVIFDFHGTLAHGGDTGQWLEAAARRIEDAGGAAPKLGDAEAEGLRAHLDQIWQHAHTFDPGSERDLSPDRHRDVFVRAVGLYPGVVPELVAALYDTMPGQLAAFGDALPVLRGLKSRGVKVVVLSNVGIDIRECLDRDGLTGLLDGVVLSYEVGLVKPDPAIFGLALDLLGVPGNRTLMVGDSPRDDVGGVTHRIRTLILPRTEGPVRGLGTVLRIVGS
jgi:FMN phosphatase YigB (HAD superfamily)